MSTAATKPLASTTRRVTSKAPTTITLQVEPGTLKAYSCNILRSRRRDVTKMFGEYVNAVSDADARDKRAELTIIVEPTRAAEEPTPTYDDQLAAARAARAASPRP